MDIQSAVYSGLQGIQRASTGIAEATVNINRQTTTPSDSVTEESTATETVNAVQQTAAPDLGQELIRLNREETNAQANVKTLQAADEILGTVIDITV